MSGLQAIRKSEGDAAKAAQIALTADEAKELEQLADTLGINAVRFWEKEMK